MKLYYLNYFLIGLLIIVKIIDILLSIWGISLGLYEINPNSFNILFLSILFICFLFVNFLGFKTNLELHLKILKYILIMFNFLMFFCIGNNLYQINMVI